MHRPYDPVTVSTMRWNNLFEDLEAQLEYELSDDHASFRATEERDRFGKISFRDRLKFLHSATPHNVHTPLQLTLRSNSTFTVGLRTLGKNWFTGDLLTPSGHYTQCVIPLTAIVALALTREQIHTSMNLNNHATASTKHLSRTDRIDMSFVLRDFCRRRCGAEYELTSGCFYGTIDRVGRDYFDLAVHDPDTTRSENNIRGYRLIPLHTLNAVRI